MVHDTVSKRQIKIFLKAQRLIQNIAKCTTDCGVIFLTGIREVMEYYFADLSVREVLLTKMCCFNKYNPCLP